METDDGKKRKVASGTDPTHEPMTDGASGKKPDEDGPGSWLSAYYLLDAWAETGTHPDRRRARRESAKCGELAPESDARPENIDCMQLTLLLAVVSRPLSPGAAGTGSCDAQAYGGRTVCKVQRIHLRRVFAASPLAGAGGGGSGAVETVWQHMSSAGIAIGATLPALARLWPSRDEVLVLMPLSSDNTHKP